MILLNLKNLLKLKLIEVMKIVKFYCLKFLIEKKNIGIEVINPKSKE